MILGSFLILGALSLVIYNNYVDKTAKETSEEILYQLEDKLNENNEVEIELDGKEYIGIIEIPALRISLPVLNEWSYPNLKIAPCCYEGSFYDNNLIIAGHNYKSHFGSLSSLSIGDKIFFININGNVYKYYVSNIETIGKYDVALMKSGDWDLTLFTCTIGGKQRITVRCILET